MASIDAARDTQKTKKSKASLDCDGENGCGDSSANSKDSEAKAAPIKRPVGAKRSLEIGRQVEALQKGANGIEGLVDQSKKRNKISEKQLELEEKKTRMSLFSMQGTDPVLLQRFLKLEQEISIKELVSKSSQHKRKCAINAQTARLWAHVILEDKEVESNPMPSDEAVLEAFLYNTDDDDREDFSAKTMSVNLLVD